MGRYEVVRIPAPYTPVAEESEEIVAYRFDPDITPFHELIFLHGIKNGNIPYLMWFAERFALYGVRTWFLILPYHGERAPDGWEGGEPFFSSSPSWCVQRFNEAVMDVLEVHRFIKKKMHSELPVSVMGISFGGMIGTMALAQDPALKKGIICCAGGNWRWINWYSPYLEPVRREYDAKGNEFGCRSEEDCVRNRGDTFRIIESFETLQDIVTKSPVTCYHYDPVSFAPFVTQEILFIQPIFDRVIHPRSYRTLRKYLKNKRVLFLPSGHKSFYLFRRLVARRVLRFLKAS
ncbi:MAG: hypothetical protein PWP37_1647 [Thermotogota bacterium]|nr:hypothetical protein [Thermotogota bacterium]MDK2865455.1 hypothetical protein [Thermotogota bacterium]